MLKTHSSDAAVQDGAKAARIRSVVYDFLSRRNRGESIEAATIESLYPELMPELSDALARGLLRLRQVFDAERAFGPSVANAGSSVDGRSEPEPGGAGSHPRIRNFRIVREISGGGQGTVFEAIQESTGRRVALKVVFAASRHAVERFEREVRALTAVDHPGVVGVIDRGRTAENGYFFAMDFVDGLDLDEWIDEKRGSSAAIREVIAMFVSTARAIEAAHLVQIVHRDLKPSNVRVDSYDHPRVVDFGLAHISSEQMAASRQLTTTGNIVGSIPWTSPEQASGEYHRLSPASDVYSLGAMMFQALTGRFPYPVDLALHVVTRNICEVVPIDPSKVKDGPFGAIDEGLGGIILKCLAKNPLERYSSGGALADALDDYLAGRISSAPRRRHSRRVLVALLAAIGLAVGATWVAHSQSQPRKPEPLVIALPSVTNSIGMRFLQIPAGQFHMGSDVREVAHQNDEATHLVTITHPFYLGETEVTRGQYRKVMGQLPPLTSKEESDDLPVDFVSWTLANEFCRKLQAIEGVEYRLPTEAEWEYACRAGTPGPFSGTQTIDDMGWYAGNSERKLHQVASRHQNQWGLFDMHGNAAEWVLDQYVPFLGSADEVDPIRQVKMGQMVIRGGSIQSPLEHCRSARRDSGSGDDMIQAVGFRVVRIDGNNTVVLRKSMQD